MTQRVFVVASGTSLIGFDFHRLENEFTISTNYNYRFHNPDILVFCDEQFYKDNKEAIDNLSCLKISKSENYNISDKDTYRLKSSSIIYWGSKGLTGGLYTPVLTGVFALSLAIALGFRPIYLLGFDHYFIDGRGHFYPAEINQTGERDKEAFNKNISLFNAFKNEKDIYNCNPNSGIKVFPAVDINSVLGERIIIDKKLIITKIRQELEGAKIQRNRDIL